MILWGFFIMTIRKTFHRKKVYLILAASLFGMMILTARLIYLMAVQGAYYQEKALQLHERERDIKASRGRILDAKGVVLADNKTVCTISVIHSQITQSEQVIEMLVKELKISEETARKRVEKVTAIERVKSNVDKEIGDRIRAYGYDGVKVDEDYKRYYPYQELASKVLGFTGGDNQGIIGLEVAYDDVLTGIDGQILTLTDARGIELAGKSERRIEPAAGYDLQISLDYNIQKYIQQAAEKVMEEKQADSVSIILMNPQNGELYGMANVPEFNLNDPFQLIEKSTKLNEEELQDALNRMWRNPSINDTYEPGSTFKIFTASAGLEEGVVSIDDNFYCGGFRIVEDRRIHCHKRTGHGSESFLEGAQNSCNPVFIDVGLRLGTERFFTYLEQMQVLKKTGVDLPGEAGAIMHKQENVGPVELATMSFGQSFQITPLQLLTMAASVVNGGTRIIPHFGVRALTEDGIVTEEYQYDTVEHLISGETSKAMRNILESVVADGSGDRAYLEGYAIGGKTATSQTLPRSANKYISSFLGFAPADDPKVIGLVIIRDPKGVYYGGTIAAPVLRDIYKNILPYLGIQRSQEGEMS